MEAWSHKRRRKHTHDAPSVRTAPRGRGTPRCHGALHAARPRYLELRGHRGIEAGGAGGGESVGQQPHPIGLGQGSTDPLIRRRISNA